MNITKKGRKPLVDLDDIFKILDCRKHEIFNENGVLKSSTSKIWKDISYALSGKKTPISIYLDLYHNRHNLQNKIKQSLGLDIKDDTLFISSDDESINSIESLEYSPTQESPLSSEKKIFKFDLPYDEFRSIYPEVATYKNSNKKRKYMILKPNTWTDVINDRFLKEHKLPCNFIYKKSYVSIDTNKSKNYLSFQAKCKDCGSDLFGWSDSKPVEGEPLKISILTKNTKGHEVQHTTKRPLKGEKRKVVGKYLETNLACNWRRENVADMEFGKFTPPNIYDQHVLRKVKEESVNNKLGITKKCPIQSILEFKYNSIYSGSIHSISFDPFIVHYWSNYQNVIYNDVSKKYTKLSIDATGGLIKKLKRSSLNLSSGAIFLYEAVVSSSVGHIPVTQMVSEKHDTLTIFYWLGQWSKICNKNPNEVVSDFSKALLGAISRAFCNGSSLHTYNDNCLKVLNGHEKYLPPCYIRIDVAHVIKIFCRIKCLTGIRSKNLKEFYVRSLRLILLSESLPEFDYILEAVLTVILSETDGCCIKNEINKTPAEEKREFILKKIRGLPDIETDIKENEDICNMEDIVIENDEKAQKTSEIANHIKSIYEKCKLNASIKGNRLSAYFLPDLAKDVLRLSNDFPLWTNVMKKIFESPYDIASSAVVENDFKELKSQILKFDVRPMKPDKFIITHLNSIQSNAKLLRSSQLRHSPELNTQPKEEKSNNICFDPLNVISNNLIIKETQKPCLPLNIDNNSDDSTRSNQKSLKKYTKTTSSSSSSNSSLCISDDCSDSASSLDATENWRGQDNNNILISKMMKQPVKKKRSTKYMQCTPEIDKILNTRVTRSKLETLLINGNSTTPIKIGKNKYLIHNTCPFDSVAVIIAMAYVDNPNYKSYLDESENTFLRFCKELAINGTSKRTYTDRGILLKTIFEEVKGITNIKLINSECNVSFMITKFFKSEPSAREHIFCSNSDCKNYSNIIPCPSIIVRLTDGFKTMETDLINYSSTHEYECSECCGCIKSSKILQKHLFIETDVYADQHATFKLDNFPVDIKIKSSSYKMYGVVAYAAGHYVAYIRRSNNTWEMHNDLLTKIKIIQNTDKVEVCPHLLVYIMNIL